MARTFLPPRDSAPSVPERRTFLPPLDRHQRAPDAPKPRRKGRSATFTPEEAKARADARRRAWKDSPEGRTYFATHRAQINATARAWRARNRDKENARLAERRKDPEFRAKAAAASDKWRKRVGEAGYWARVRARQRKKPDYAVKLKLWNQRSRARLKETPEGRAKLARWAASSAANRKAKLAADPKVREATRLKHRRYQEEFRLRQSPDPKVRARALKRAWERKHRAERTTQNKRKWAKRQADPALMEQTRERLRQWRASETGSAKTAAWVKANREKINARQQARYAQIKADPKQYAAYLAANRRRRASTSSPRLEALPYPYRAAERSPMLASVMKLIPKRVLPEVRPDLCQDLIADICAQLVTLEQLADRQVMNRYVARANKQVLGDYGILSLDEAIPGTDGDLLRIDTIAAGTSIYTATQYKQGRKAKRPSTST